MRLTADKSWRTRIHRSTRWTLPFPPRGNGPVCSTSCTLLHTIVMTNVPAGHAVPYGAVSRHLVHANATLILTVVDIILNPLSQVCSLREVSL